MKHEEQDDAGDTGDPVRSDTTDVVEPEHALPLVTMEELRRWNHLQMILGT